MIPNDPVLECQTCGKVLRHLSMSEAQKVAANPYNYVAFCDPCRTSEEDQWLL